MTITEHLDRLCRIHNPKLTQQLLPQSVVDAIPALYAQDGKGAEATAHVKLFGAGRWTWFFTEASPILGDDEPLTTLASVPADRIAAVTDVALFGWCVSGLGQDCDEYGYSRLLELADVAFPPFGLPIERDVDFDAQPIGPHLTKRFSNA